MNSVKNLKKATFQTLPLDDKLKIRRMGRPLPDTDLIQVSERKTDQRRVSRHLAKDIYLKNNWICGCDVTKLLYCFPCLLFYEDIPGTSPYWAKMGVQDLNNLDSHMKQHETTQSHINTCTELALLGIPNILSHSTPLYKEGITLHNNSVRKNRYILKKIISFVKFSSVFELTLGHHDEKEGFESREIYRKLINFTEELDAKVKEQLLNTTVFKGTTAIIQNDILDSMMLVCKEEISNQIKHTDFVSIQCDETTDVSSSCQIVLIVRYFYDGSIREYVLGFETVKDQTSTGLKMYIENEISSLILKTPDKLIAQTYDGANVINGIWNTIKQKFPNAHFVHCYAHQVQLVMQKAASINARVRVFFNNLSAIPAFFSDSSHQCEVFQKILVEKLPRVTVAGWNYNIRTVNTVYENLDKLVEVFKEIERSCVKTVTSREASGLRRAMEDPEFIFWLRLFHKILPQVDILYDQLKTKNKSSAELEKEFQMFETSITIIKNEAGDNDKESIDSFSSTSKRRRTENHATRVANAKEVCDIIANQMKERFSYRGHLYADELFNKEPFVKYSEVFPHDIFKAVTAFYPMLSKLRLLSELDVIYSRSDLRQISGAMNLLTFLLENGLEPTFVETTKLLKIIVTTPMNTPEPERKLSTLKRIQAFLRNSVLNDRLSALAMMSINGDLVHEIKDFEEKVIEKFISMKNRQAGFCYRN